jgi:hypothetical protein
LTKKNAACEGTFLIIWKANCKPVNRNENQRFNE